MGEVYEVEHTTLRRHFALKLLTEDLASHVDSLERFRRVARAMANLDHPNIVRVDDFGETDGHYWLRMELVEGIEEEVTEGTEKKVVSLQDVADAHNGKLPQELLLTILKQVLAGLSYAHGHGVVHRDLKPSNILLDGTLDGGPATLTAKVGDFGMVRMVGEEWVQPRAQRSVKRSLSLGGEQTLGDEDDRTRSLLGTYEYMSPEQKRGEEADERTDIYALGLMTFKLLTGRSPGTKPPSRIDTGLARGWDELAARALEVERDARIATCDTLLELLNAVSAELGMVTAQPAREDGIEERSEQAKRDASHVVLRPGRVPHGSRPEPGVSWTLPDLGVVFMSVASGRFEMGSNDWGQAEGPVHTVRIMRDFWMGKYEVTQAEYEKVVGRRPSRFKGSNNPVERVSWADAVAFCVKLTEYERLAGRLPMGYEYRLPTEAEWEYAARGGTRSGGFRYAGSNNARDVAWYTENSGGRPHPVGEKTANELGIHDMSGNVWEWCLDWYDDEYYSHTQGASDPVNLVKGACRAGRGGSWSKSAGYARSTNRFRMNPSFASQYVGFRICLAHKVR